MNGHSFSFGGARFVALPSGALWWPERALLCVSDLHLGKSDRIARRSGTLLPPYESLDTLARLESVIAQTGAARVLCLGDSFDDLESADSIDETLRDWLLRMTAGREWIWLEGNHDPGPIAFPGTHRSSVKEQEVIFQHIAQPRFSGTVSGHYHPKARISARGGAITRPCFLLDGNNLILPAFGTYTGGLFTDSAVLTALMQPDAIAILTGRSAIAIPMPRKS